MRVCMWVLLVLVLGEFALLAYGWLSYCPPTAAAGFAFSGKWNTEEFPHRQAGIALDQPTVGKAFLWTSFMSYLACAIILLLHTLVDAGRRVARRVVTVSAALLVALVLVEFLVPTFMLIQYILSRGLTVRRVLGLLLCLGFWITLPAVVFWIRKADPSRMKWATSPLTWALACSVVAPAYYFVGILQPSVWRHWTTTGTMLLLMWLILLAPVPCILLLRAWGKPHANHESGLP